MPSVALSIFTDPVLQPIGLVAVVMLVETLWTWPEKFQPLIFARLLAIRMADKVHPSTNRSELQQKISGSLAIFMLLLPLAVILIIFTRIAQFPLFFDALLLFVALPYQTVVKRSQQVAKALGQQKKTLARQTLSYMVLRETERLTPIGIAKATIESLLLRFGQQYCSVIFYYFIFGGVGALCYRLIYEFSHCWNMKLHRFTSFGYPTAKIMHIMQFIPVRLCGLIFMLVQDISGGFAAWRNGNKNRCNHMWLLTIQGGALGIELGGPAYYNNQKSRFSKCGGQRQVRFADIQRTIRAVQLTKVVMLAICLLMGSALYGWQRI
ncbi:MAG: adenosylcobinamide-phosphate synthase [Paraglaciecola sp.]